MRPVPPRVTWSDPNFGDFLETLLAYERMARMLFEGAAENNRLLRESLHERLSIDPLVRLGQVAQLGIRRRGSLTLKEYHFSHPALGEFAKAVVLRGASYVTDVAFSSPKVLIPLRTLVGLDESRQGQWDGSFSPDRRRRRPSPVQR